MKPSHQGMTSSTAKQTHFLLLKASGTALFIVIVLALVIGILCSALVLVGYHYKAEVYDTNVLKKLEANTESCMQYLLSPDQFLSFDKDSLFDLYEEGSDSVLLKRMHWGLFEIGMARAFSGRHSLDRIWMYGYAPAQEAAAAVYLVDYGRPLSVSGTNRIKGDCFLPEAGVKRAYIEGQSFTGENMVEGKVNKSGKMLPVLEKSTTSMLVSYLENNLPASGGNSEVEETLSADTLIRSFLGKGLLIHLKGATRLSNRVLSGNIVFVCDTTLVIDSSAKLENILVFASGIKVEKGFRGSVQLFAKDSIVVEEECVFSYPTAMGLFKTDLRTTQPFIRIGKNASVTGVLLSYQNVTDLQQTLISISPKALVTGQVYADGFLDVKGSVHGSVMCSKFLLKTPSTIYENHLLNATIDRTKLPRSYAGSAILPVKTVKKIIQYLE